MLRLCVVLSIVTIGIFGICGFFAYACFINYEYAVEQEKAVYGGNIVEAEYTRVFSNSSINYSFGAINGTSTRYGLYYQFAYEGKTYEERGYALMFGERQEEEARTYIGQKVNVYVGEKAASIIVGETPNIYGAIIPAIVLTAVMTAWVLLVIWMLATVIYNRRKNSKMEEIEQEEQEQQEVQNSPSE